jgi:hypothetical protein
MNTKDLVVNECIQSSVHVLSHIVTKTRLGIHRNA